ncbi:MAG: hypothetical protein Q8Q08_05305 [Candidatus Omnitrophota bacterium]|nr:hypothetical protein [Candidatus Omnitrophota bacterium]MDZ4242355.1 hypothetical protein [Candidatus Omnitrophota bacterium]
MLKNKTVLALAGILVIVFALRLPFIQNRTYNMDEAFSALIAHDILDGKMPYQGALNNRSPLVYYAYAAAFALFGRDNMPAVYVMLALTVAAQTILICLLGAWGGDRRLGLWAAFFFAVFSWAGPPTDMWAVHTEWFLILFSILGMIGLVVWGREERPFRLVLCGIFFGLAALSKQVGVFDFGAAAAYVFLYTVMRKQGLKSGFFCVLLLSAGFFSILLLASFYFYANGAWEDYLYYVWTYNNRHYIPELGWGERSRVFGPHLWGFYQNKYLLVIFGTAGLLWALCGLRSAPENSGLPRRDFCLLLCLWFFFGLAGASLSARGFEHYFLQTLPAAVLLAAYGLRRVESQWPGLRAIFYSFALVSLLLSVAGTFLRYYREVCPLDPSAPSLSAYVKDRTSKDDSIFVWGNYPELYLHSGRRPATRFVDCNFLTGLTYKMDANGAFTTGQVDLPAVWWTTFIAELEQSRPAMIIDVTPVADFRYQAHPISRYPRLKKFLDRYYQLDPQYRYTSYPGTIQIYVRKP